jgi:hypothetical protein
MNDAPSKKKMNLGDAIRLANLKNKIGRSPLYVPARQCKPIAPVSVSRPTTPEKVFVRDDLHILECIRGRADAVWHGYKPLPCDDPKCRDFDRCMELKRMIR